MSTTPEILVAPVRVNKTPKASRPKVVPLDGNRCLVAYSIEVGGSIFRRIRGQVFGASGDQIGPENSFVFNLEIEEERFDMAALSGNRIVIAAEALTDGNDGRGEIGIVTRAYQIGTAGSIRLVGDQFKDFSSVHNLVRPAIVGINSQSFRFCYSDVLSRLSGNKLVFHGLDGAQLFGPKSVSTYRGRHDTTIDMDVLTNGNLIVFVDPDGQDRRRGELHLYLLEPGGRTIREIIGGSDEGRTFHAKVAALTGGGFVTAFTENDGGDINVVYRVYRENGDPLRNNTLVGIDINGAEDNDNNEPAIVALPDGGFIIFYDKDNGTPEIRGRRYNFVGNPIGDDFRVFAERGAQISAALLDDGIVAVAYQVTGSETVQVAILNGMPEVVRGTDDGDFLLGTDERDVIFGGGGDDTISGRDSFDRLDGGAGDDVVTGGEGTDIVRGGPGADTLFGFSGDDFLEGGPGNDVLSGGQGSDRFTFRDGDGVNEIRDFDPSDPRERIDLRDVTAITSFPDLQANHLTQTGELVNVEPGGEVGTTQTRGPSDAIIDDGAGLRIVLKGVNVSDLKAGDFII